MADRCSECGRTDQRMARVGGGTSTVNGKRVGDLCIECMNALCNQESSDDE